MSSKIKLLFSEFASPPRRYVHSLEVGERLIRIQCTCSECRIRVVQIAGNFVGSREPDTNRKIRRRYKRLASNRNPVRRFLCFFANRGSVRVVAQIIKRWSIFSGGGFGFAEVIETIRCILILSLKASEKMINIAKNTSILTGNYFKFFLAVVILAMNAIRKFFG